MTEKPLVSVIINCYNGEKYLRETIDSVMSQTYGNWELVFWDNQSTDSSREIVKSYVSDKIHYYYSEHTSLGEARNLALKKCNGAYISFLDADDVWEPGFLEQCVECCENHSNVVLTYTRYINFDEKKEWPIPGRKKSGEITLPEIISAYNIGMSGALFCSNIIKKFNITFDKRFSLIEDYDFFLRLGALGIIYYIATPLMRYRCHNSNLSQNKKEKWLIEQELFYQKAKEDVTLGPGLQEIREVYEMYKVRDLLYKNNKKEAFCYIIKKVWRNPYLARYIYALVFGMERFHRLRTN